MEDDLIQNEIRYYNNTYAANDATPYNWGKLQARELYGYAPATLPGKAIKLTDEQFKQIIEAGKDLGFAKATEAQKNKAEAERLQKLAERLQEIERIAELKLQLSEIQKDLAFRLTKLAPEEPTPGTRRIDIEAL